MQNIKWEKILVSVGMGLSGYFAILQNFTTLPALPSFVNNLVLSLAGGAVIYGIYMLWSKY